MPDPKDDLPDAPEHRRPSNVGPAELGIDYRRLEARVLHGPRTRHRWPFDHNVYAQRVFRKARGLVSNDNGDVSRVFDWAGPRAPVAAPKRSAACASSAASRRKVSRACARRTERFGFSWSESGSTSRRAVADLPSSSEKSPRHAMPSVSGASPFQSFRPTA
jgi:hypothetical protein